VDASGTFDLSEVIRDAMVQLPTEMCFFCKRVFAFGGDQSDGEYLQQLNLGICRWCRSSNEGGLNPHYEKRLLPYLWAKKLPIPSRNEKGFLVLPTE
jgi:hypothetical protein